MDNAVIERFFKNVNKTSTCWLWTGPIDPRKRRGGYGVFSYKTIHNAHRFSYEIHKSKIKKGFVIDHLCRIRHCVNPEHLQAVRPKTNTLRGIGITAMNARKTHCIHGHQFNKTNTVFKKPKNRLAYRVCGTCRKLQWQKDNGMAQNQARKADDLREKWKQFHQQCHRKLKSHCSDGHEFTIENTRIVSRRGILLRQCRICDRIRTRKSRKITSDRFRGSIIPDHVGPDPL